MGLKVKYKFETRKLKNGQKEINYRQAAKRRLKKRREGRISLQEFISEIDTLKDKYFLNELETKEGVGDVLYKDKFDGLEFIKIKGVGFINPDDIEYYFKHNERLAKMLHSCYKMQSYATKTGVIYSYSGENILEYVKSTKNVWATNKLLTYFPEMTEREIEEEIKFFLGNTKNILLCDLNYILG